MGSLLKAMRIIFDDNVEVREMQVLMTAMSASDTGRFPAKAIFHYSLRSVEKEEVALQYGINVTARDDEGVLVGYLRVISDRSYIHYIVDVMVRPDCQGERVGSALVSHTLARLQESGFIKVILTAIPGKEEFYKRLGFQETMSPVLVLRGEDYPIEERKGGGE